MIGGIRISVLDNLDDFLGMAAEWNSLLEESQSASIFLTWEWLSSWARCCIDETRSLFILTFHDKDRLIGIAPLYIQLNKTGPFLLKELHFLGTPESGSDYITVITRKGLEKVVAASFYDYLSGIGACSWDKLVLTDIRSDDLFLMYFMGRIHAAGKYAEFLPVAYCPLAMLPATESEYFELISAGWKKKCNQNARIINREQDVIHEVIHGKAVADKLPEFLRLYEEKGGWSGDTVRSVLKQLVAININEPPIQIDLLTINGQLVAGLLHLKYRNTLSMYLMAVDKEYNPKVSLGTLLVGQAIANAVASGFAVYDFLKGDESYKFHWANGGNRTVQLSFWQKRPVAMLSAFGRLIAHAGKLLLR